MTKPITAKIAQELVEHEGIVREAYKDSVGVWTFGVGMTNASGHTVYPRYKDNPQPMDRVLELYLWVLERNYATTVREVFDGYEMTEEEFAAALSFHYNTGAIKRASWVDAWKAGNMADAERRFMQWNKPSEIIPRRQKEADLLFRGKWSQTGLANEYPVNKPSYTPNWGGVRKVETLPIFEALLDTEPVEPPPPTEPTYDEIAKELFMATDADTVHLQDGQPPVLIYHRPRELQVDG